MVRSDEYGDTPADASDARLTDLLRADTSTLYPALQELRTRHQPSVLSYARLCTTSESAARQLAAQTFTLAARETARGVDPGVPWRHQLLLLTVRVAASWSRDDRSTGLDSGLLLLLNTTDPAPSMLPAFLSLPSRSQGLVWYGIVEREPQAVTAAFLGLTPEDVVHGTEPALQAMAQACLRSRLAASDDPRCGDFRRLIEESVRPDHPRDSADLHAHMAHCAHCTGAYEELTALRDAPRATLAEGLLPWAGTSYATRGREEVRSNSLGNRAGWTPSRRLVLTSAALGVALVPLLFLVLRPGGSTPRPGAAAGTVAVVPSTPTEVTVTATIPVTPSTTPSKSPSPTPSSKPTHSPSPSPSPATHAPNGTYARIVNVSTNRCLDIRDGDLTEGTDVVTAPCTSSDTQLWRVDAARGVVQSSADSDLCLDSRGSVEKGVGVWECDSVDGSHGDNLKFTVDSDGVIRPAIAILTGMTPEGGDGVSLVPLSGGAEQRWRAG
ncbi:ricin-type beta-trefoil lectin domain protein [Streptomyces sp. MBT65]|uniref:RICIN domain-containing protein n=1 Tax=Streptomyces sp. MBT65 TaxID=1488395 RepID=UPI00190A5CD4|nr:RICIN domain-containing protein [Streptomyces sp. MBT65]MBK3576202.1 ricin-type beta-trefoil lectin domain protein [Streptomyces sp. MBT65]